VIRKDFAVRNQMTTERDL